LEWVPDLGLIMNVMLVLSAFMYAKLQKQIDFYANLMINFHKTNIYYQKDARFRKKCVTLQPVTKKNK